MKNVLIVWELGGGYGHVGTFMELARRLRSNGCEVAFALGDLARGGQTLQQLGFRCTSAPSWNRNRGIATRSHNYTEMLTRIGFLDPDRLAAVVRQWRDLYQRLAADIVIANHAPTAMFATAGLDLRRVLYGTGFECPPRLTPFPKIDPDCDLSKQRFVDSERQVLATINDICSQLNVEPKHSVAGILEADEEFLCTFAELDPYREHRQAPEYWGPQIDSRLSIFSKWRAARNKQAIFAYLRPEYSRLSETIRALQETGRKVVVHCPGLPREYVTQFTADNLCFSAEPLATRQMLSQFGLVVSHAGHGTSLALLLEGRAHFMLPMNLEQEMNAKAVYGLGAGLFVDREDERKAIGHELARALDSDSLAQGAREFAQRYEGFSARAQTKGITSRILRLLGD